MKLSIHEIDKRIKVELDKSIKTNNVSGIMTFGEDNNYPQIIERLVYASSTAKSCSKIYSKFISGSGFSNQEIGKVVM